MKPIRILLADDHSLLRLGLTTLMKFHKEFEVVGCAENGLEAVSLAEKLEPDVIIMDLMMPVMDGVEATKRIHDADPDIRILLLTSFGTSAEVVRAIEAGASGALMKDTANDDLLSAIRAVASGESVFSPEIKKQIDSASLVPKFTQRQIDILQSVTQGHTNGEIARQLGISPDCIKKHLIVICNKLGASNRAEAASLALRKHLLKI